MPAVGARKRFVEVVIDVKRPPCSDTFCVVCVLARGGEQLQVIFFAQLFEAYGAMLVRRGIRRWRGIHERACTASFVSLMRKRQMPEVKKASNDKRLFVARLV